MGTRSEIPEWLADFNWDAFDPATVEPTTLQRLESALAPFFASLTKKEFEDGCVQRRILGYAVATAADIAVDEQLAARDSWQELADAESGKTLRYPVGYARFGGQVMKLSRPAPRCGEHQAAVVAEFGLAEVQPA
jgi:crotonobetainyl-CoA:carnitine CoA-transferase CaiB-like acyl-CoA transferase